MPRAYGLMGLVKDGKGYFRENLHLVAELSGITEVEILESPEKNVLAYAHQRGMARVVSKYDLYMEHFERCVWTVFYCFKWQYAISTSNWLPH